MALEEMKVAVVDAVPTGGIVQFSNQIFRTLLDCGADARFWAPAESGVDTSDRTTLFERRQSINPRNACVRGLEEGIRAFDPDAVLMTDVGVIVSQLQLALGDMNTYMCVHDPTPHPSYGGLKATIRERLREPYSRRALGVASHIVLMSRASKDKFDGLHPEWAGKTSLLRLGAHVPEAGPIEPIEMVGQDNFYLFFGRIDKYKGLGNLVEAFHCSSCKRGLVIAGKGHIEEDIRRLIEQDPRIVCLNRFIGDGELVWLFQNAHMTVLPYIEASQSGVLPISYAFGVPVIASCLSEFDEYVVEGQTGWRYCTNDELTGLLEDCDSDARIDTMRVACKSFEARELSWAGGLGSLLGDDLRTGHAGV